MCALSTTHFNLLRRTLFFSLKKNKHKYKFKYLENGNNKKEEDENNK